MILDKFIEIQSPKSRAPFEALVKDAVIVKVQNVSDYLYQSPQEQWSSEDFPCVAPPWEKMWMEWRTPSSWLSDKEPPPEMAGFISWKKIGSSLWRMQSDSFERAALFVAHEPEWAGEVGARWMISCVGLSLTQPDGFLFEYKFFVAPDGRLIEVENTPANIEFVRRYIQPMGDLDDKLGLRDMPLPLLLPRVVCPWIGERVLRGERTIDHSYFDVCWLALSFCNCKNVERVVNRPAEKVQQKRAKHGKPPLHSFYTLHIGPIQKIISQAGERDTALQKRLHIVRGHFKVFDERPLFGKHKGAFWWPQQIRGQGEKVDKGYEVDAPQ